MNRSDLITAMSRRFPQLSSEDVDVAARAIVEAISRSMCQGTRVEIRGFGSFYLNHRSHRTGRNPRTGEPVNVPEKRVPHFKGGKDLTLRVNKQPGQPAE
jgi:integration host factor subunit beta